MLLFVSGCHTNQDDVAVIIKTVLLLRVQTAGISALGWASWKWKCKTCHFLQTWGLSYRKTGSLTESDDGQNDGDCYGHPGHPQSFLAVTLGFVRLQAHAAFQETCRKTAEGTVTRQPHDSDSQKEEQIGKWEEQLSSASIHFMSQLVITEYKLEELTFIA